MGVAVEGKFNIAVIGCGSMAQGVHIPNILRHPEINLKWCCDVDEKVLRVIAQKFHPDKTTSSIEEVAADPECHAALIATHPAGRLELVKILASVGKHIYAEKPIADNMLDMLEIQRNIKDADIVFTVGHNRRLSPAITEARRLFQKHRENPISEPWRWDRIGNKRPNLKQDEETMMLFRINDDYYSWKEWCFADDAGILLLELNHFTDLAHYFIGTEPVSVSASGSQIMNVVLNIKFECGSICTIFDACVGSFGYPKELYEIYHKGAVVSVDHCMEVRTSGIHGEIFRKLYPPLKEPYSAGIESFYTRTLEAIRSHKDGGPISSPNPDKGHYRILDAFVRACRGEEENPCTALDGARAAAIVLKASESLALGGAPVKIEQGDYSAEM
jgi:predicted dehydrogenase